jgi:ribosomal protein L29
MACDYHLTNYDVQAMQRRYPDLWPQPIMPRPLNRLVYKKDAFDRVLRAAGHLKDESMSETPEAETTQPATAASEPDDTEATEQPRDEGSPPTPQSKLGRLLATNKHARRKHERLVATLRGYESDADALAQVILELDSGSGQTAAEARDAEIEAINEQIAELKAQLLALRAEQRRAGAHSVEELPDLRRKIKTLLELIHLQRTVVEGSCAQIALNHQLILGEGRHVEEAEVPEVHDTPEDISLYRRIAAGELKTLDGLAQFLGLSPSALRALKARIGAEWPESAGKKPHSTAELYPVAKVQRLCAERGAAYADQDLAA